MKYADEFIHTVFFPLIHMALGGTSHHIIIDEEDLGELLKLGTKQSIVAIIWKGLVTQDYPKCLIRSFDLAHLKDTRDYIVRDDSYKKICAALNENCIPYIPLKGSVLKDLYPEPWMRTSCDIDILVHEEDLDKAVTAIERSTDFKSIGRGYHDVSMVNSAVHLELHFSIKEQIEDIDRLLANAWDYARKTENGSCYIFSPEYQIFHTLAHMSYHLRHSGLGIRPFLDLWLLKTKTIYDEITLQQYCSTCGILTFYNKCCEMLAVWMNEKPLNSDLKVLEDYCLNGGVYGNSKIASAAVLRESRGYKYLVRRLFIRKSVLQELYPNLRRKPYLLPYYQLKRWLRLCNKQRRKRAVGELKGIYSIREEQIVSFDQLLISLGF